MPSLSITNITQAQFTALLSRYPSTVPPNLHDLDAQRYSTIPSALAKRRTDSPSSTASLEKPEVLILVEWKLKHGTFRPKLLQLVQSNPAALVRETTTKAFALLSSDPSSPLQALKVLISLKGIGPATASLLLSAYDPDGTPFFSDEVFRWTHWEDPAPKARAGWKREIKYNVREYEGLVERVGLLKERLGVDAMEVEKVAWVLGKEGVDVGANDGDLEEADERVSREEELKQDEWVAVKQEKREVKKDASKQATKRKIEYSKDSEGLRRSSRRKMEK